MSHDGRHKQNEAADDAIQQTCLIAGKFGCEHTAVFAVEKPIPIGYCRAEREYARQEEKSQDDDGRNQCR